MKNNVFQIMRGVCIIAVVLTHIIDKNITNPNYEVALIIQNIVNIAVTGFIFLAGYFINTEEVKANPKQFIFRKSKRILVPYFLWSAIYIISNIVVAHQNYTLVSLTKIFLLGRASAPLYYCILYFLFILITPFIIKRMENKIWNIVFYFIMPIWFILCYYMQLNYQISFANRGLLPFTYFLYFYLGLKWKWRRTSIELNIFIIIALIFIGYFLESVETCLLFSPNLSSFSVTPTRFSTILYVLPIILLFLKLKNINLSKNNIFVSLGNNSFGIFLSHMLVLSCLIHAVNKFLIQYNTIQYIIYVIIILLITILTTNVAINICKRLISNKLLKWIGFI